MWTKLCSLIEECETTEFGVDFNLLKKKLEESHFVISIDRPRGSYTIEEALDAIEQWQNHFGESWLEGCVPNGISTIEYTAWLINKGYKERIDEMIKEGYFYGNPYIENIDLFGYEDLYSKDDLEDEEWEETHKKNLTLIVKFIKYKGKLKELIENLKLKTDEDYIDLRHTWKA